MFLNDIYQALDPIAFTLGPLTVRWYGLAYLAGFIVAGFVIPAWPSAGSSTLRSTTW